MTQLTWNRFGSAENDSEYLGYIKLREFNCMTTLNQLQKVTPVGLYARCLVKVMFFCQKTFEVKGWPRTNSSHTFILVINQLDAQNFVLQ